MGNCELRFYEHGRLVSICVSGNSLRVIYAAGSPVCQLGGTSFTETKLIAIDKANSVLASTCSSAVKRVTYCAYGANSIRSLPAALGYNGEYLETFGVYLLGRGERGYSPRLRRFISADRASIFLAGNLNSYAYTAGDPINYNDPSGNFRGLIARYKDWKGSKALAKASENLKYHIDSTENLEYNIGHEERKFAQVEIDIEATATGLKATETKMLALMDSMAKMDDTVIYESSKHGLKARYLYTAYAKKAAELIKQASAFDALTTKSEELGKVISQARHAEWKLKQNEIAITAARNRLDYLVQKYPRAASKAIRKMF